MSSLSFDPARGGPSSGSDHSKLSMSCLQSLEGYEYEFDPPLGSKYECPICLLVLREPSQTKCGHRFCRECILRTLKNSSTRCPIDNEPLTEADIYPDNFAKREILNCRIKCPNKDDGCEKVFPLCELKAHLQECQFTLVPCPNKCGCILPQRDIKDHVGRQCGLRIVMCTSCGANIHAELAKEHVSICPKIVVKCKHCQKEMTRDLIDHHLQTSCDNVTILCPFYPLGCQSSFKRKSEDKHLMEEGPTHLRQLCGAVTHVLAQMNSHMRYTVQRDASPDWQLGPSQVGKTNRNLEDKSNESFNQSQLPSSSVDASLVENVTVVKSSSENLNPIGSSHNPFNEDSCHPHSLPSNRIGSKMVQRQEASSLPFLRDASQPTLSPDDAKHCSPPPNINALASTISNFNIQSLPCALQCQTLSPDERRVTTATDQSHCSQRELSQAETSTCHHQSASLPSGSEGLATDGASTIPLLLSMVEQVSVTYEQKLEASNNEITDLKSTVSNLKKQNDELSQVVTELKSLIANISKTCYGTLFWTIQGFKGLKQKALKGEIVTLRSQPFCTSAWGYKMCLRANITNPQTSSDGTPDQQYLSLFVHVMQGDNDAILPWPFTGKISLALLDQNKDKSLCKHVQETLETKPNLSAFQRPVLGRNQKGFGFIEFVRVTDIEEGTYLVDDCLVVYAQIFPNKG